jgi:hypothetical protein
VVANSMLTSTTAAAPKASTVGSLASTAQPVGSLALSGEGGRAGTVFTKIYCYVAKMS